MSEAFLRVTFLLCPAFADLREPFVMVHRHELTEPVLQRNKTFYLFHVLNRISSKVKFIDIAKKYKAGLKRVKNLNSIRFGLNFIFCCLTVWAFLPIRFLPALWRRWTGPR